VRGRPIIVDTRQARGSYRLDVWSTERGCWVANCFYREIDWGGVDRRVANINDGVGDVQLVDVRSGDAVGVWANGRRVATAVRLKGLVRK